MIPKYIIKKIDRLELLLRQAYLLKREIEKWAEKKGIDISSNEWYENVVDEISGVNGIYKEGLDELLKNI